MSSVSIISEILDKLRLSIARNGIYCINLLKQTLNECESNDYNISKHEFESCLIKNGLHLSKHDINCLFNAYKSDELNINYNKFLNELQIKLNGKRLNIVKNLFEKLKRNKENNTIIYDDLIKYYDYIEHPNVKLGQLSKGMAKELINKSFTIKNKNEIDFNEFCDNFNGISTGYPYNDAYFIEFINNCWHKLFNDNLAKKEIKNNNDNFIKKTQYLLIDKVKQKTTLHNEIYTLTKAFRHFDLPSISRIDFKGFVNALETFGILLPQKEAKMWFEMYSDKNDNMLDYNDFAKKLFKMCQ